jgi:hypothetical protein
VTAAAAPVVVRCPWCGHEHRHPAGAPTVQTCAAPRHHGAPERRYLVFVQLADVQKVRT